MKQNWNTTNMSWESKMPKINFLNWKRAVSGTDVGWKALAHGCQTTKLFTAWHGVIYLNIKQDKVP